MSLRYEEHPLPRPLSRFVECVWFLRAPRGAAPATPERVVPDGCPELVVQLAGPIRAGRPGQTRARQPAALLVGPLSSSLLLEPEGDAATMGVRFRPGGLAAFLRIPGNELADRQVHIEDVFGQDGGALADRLREAGSDSFRVQIASSFLLARFSDGGPSARPVEFAIARMLDRRGPVPIESLAREIGLTRRQLERSFRRRAGLTPMQLGRVIRFQNVFRALPAAGADWVSVALDCGYYDQSHLIRDFREFTGESPRAFLREDGAFRRVFLSPARLERFFR